VECTTERVRRWNAQKKKEEESTKEKEIRGNKEQQNMKDKNKIQ
jgi:hypothetical protein